MSTRHWVLAGVALVLGLVGGTYLGSFYEQRPKQVVDNFHLLFHKNGATTYNDTRWRGVSVQKSPFDMWAYQELLYETKPDVIVEAGTFKGGSAYYFASLFDMIGKGRVISLDIEEQPNLPQHPRITYIKGSSTDPATIEKVKSLLQPGDRVMVSLDSDHHKDHVLQELRLYSPMVSPGCYLVVEDTHMGGHPILPKHGPGPFEAVQEFMSAKPPFVIDHSREKFLMSFNYGGWLKRQ